VLLFALIHGLLNQHNKQVLKRAARFVLHVVGERLPVDARVRFADALHPRAGPVCTQNPAE